MSLRLHSRILNLMAVKSLLQSWQKHLKQVQKSYFPGWEKASVRRKNCGINLKNILVKMEKHTSGERVRRSAHNHDTE